VPAQTLSREIEPIVAVRAFEFLINRAITVEFPVYPIMRSSRSTVWFPTRRFLSLAGLAVNH
jgi:hypothetical protein